MLLATAVAAQLQPTGPASPAGYLDSKHTPDLLLVVPRSPVPGDQGDEADRAIFRATRSAQGTPRWTMAQQDADYSVTGLLNTFACALGAYAGPQNAPRLAELIGRVSADADAASGAVKKRYGRKRPFQ